MYSVLVAATAMIFCEGRETARHARGGGSESGRARVGGARARLVRVEGSMQDPLRKVEGSEEEAPTAEAMRLRAICSAWRG